MVEHSKTAVNDNKNKLNFNNAAWKVAPRKESYNEESTTPSKRLQLVNQIVSVEEAKDARRRTLQEQIDYSRELYLNKKHHERKDSQEKSSKKQDKSSSNKSSLKKRIKNDIEFDSSSSQSSLQGSINDRKSQENLKNFSRHTISEANESNLTSFKTDSDVEMQTPIEPNADQPQLIFKQSSQPKEGTPMHDRKGTSYFPEERDVYEFKRIETLKNQSPEPLIQTEEKQKQSEAKTISKLMIKAGTYYGFGQAKDSIELPDIPEPKITYLTTEHQRVHNQPYKEFLSTENSYRAHIVDQMEDQIEEIMIYNSKEHGALEKYLHAIKKGVKRTLKRAQKDPREQSKLANNLMLVVKGKGESAYRLNVIKEEVNNYEPDYKNLRVPPSQTVMGSSSSNQDKSQTTTVNYHGSRDTSTPNKNLLQIPQNGNSEFKEEDQMFPNPLDMIQRDESFNKEDYLKERKVASFPTKVRDHLRFFNNLASKATDEQILNEFTTQPSLQKNQSAAQPNIKGFQIKPMISESLAQNANPNLGESYQNQNTKIVSNSKNKEATDNSSSKSSLILPQANLLNVKKLTQGDYRLRHIKRLRTDIISNFRRKSDPVTLTHLSKGFGDHFQKHNQGQIGNILKEKFQLFKPSSETSHYERRPLYENKMPAAERIDFRFNLKEEINSRRSSRVLSVARAQTLGEVKYLDRKVEDLTQSMYDTSTSNMESESMGRTKTMLSENNMLSDNIDTSSLARSKTQFDMIKNYLYIVKRTAEKRKDDEKAHRFLTLDTDFIDTNRIHSNALKRLLTPGDSPKEKHEYLSKEEMQGFNPRFVKDLHPEKRDVVNLTLNLSQMNDLKESSLKNFVIQSQITRENPYDDFNQRRLRQLTVRDPSNVQPLYQATDAMVKELSHIKNNPYNQEYWQVHNSRVEDLLEGMQNQSKIDTLRDNASAYLSTVNTQRMQAEDFIIKNSSYRNKEIKKLERLAAKNRSMSVIDDSRNVTLDHSRTIMSGPSLKFQRQMLDPYFQMKEQQVQKHNISETVIINKARQREFNKWYIKPEVERKHTQKMKEMLAQAIAKKIRSRSNFR
ncbi:hypothetical protein FGO68_gene10669 [Halteria grandinella]|uniref:Uncharacterized protein n=1 Tax=Halteria grandinella TaxID=5974 RepID=A0A8J8P2C2_HALGN|nr:hypothetical protein FGO68_gene10669 [Halteria grandinella]